MGRMYLGCEKCTYGFCPAVSADRAYGAVSQIDLYLGVFFAKIAKLFAVFGVKQAVAKVGQMQHHGQIVLVCQRPHPLRGKLEEVGFVDVFCAGVSQIGLQGNDVRKMLDVSFHLVRIVLRANHKTGNKTFVFLGQLAGEQTVRVQSFLFIVVLGMSHDQTATDAVTAKKLIRI